MSHNHWQWQENCWYYDFRVVNYDCKMFKRLVSVLWKRTKYRNSKTLAKTVSCKIFYSILNLFQLVQRRKPLWWKRWTSWARTWRWSEQKLTTSQPNCPGTNAIKLIFAVPSFSWYYLWQHFNVLPMEHLSRKRWTTGLALSVSYSVREGIFLL